MPLGAFRSALMGVAGASVEDVALLKTLTASGVSQLVFTGLSSTYNEYVFGIYDIHPSANNIAFQFNVSSDGGTTYDMAKSTVFWVAQLTESHTNAALQIQPGDDVALASAGSVYAKITAGLGYDNDQSVSGELHLFNPGSTTLVKNFYSRAQEYHASDYAIDNFGAGYINSTTAINTVTFEMASGNLDTGTIKMWGIK